MWLLEVSALRELRYLSRLIPKLAAAFLTARLRSPPLLLWETPRVVSSPYCLQEHRREHLRKYYLSADFDCPIPNPDDGVSFLVYLLISKLHQGTTTSLSSIPHNSALAIYVDSLCHEIDGNLEEAIVLGEKLRVEFPSESAYFPTLLKNPPKRSLIYGVYMTHPKECIDLARAVVVSLLWTPTANLLTLEKVCQRYFIAS